MHRNRRDTLKLLTAGALAGFVPPLARAARDDLYDLGRSATSGSFTRPTFTADFPVYFPRAKRESWRVGARSASRLISSV